MFNKAVQSASICLRCQSRLLRQQTTCSSAARRQQPKYAARWQSTAVARAEDDNENVEDRVQVNGGLEIRQHSADSMYLRPKRRRTVSDQYQTAYRKFRPDRVSELGVSSLGKPAEVIVLQPRDRYIPRVPNEDDGHKDPGLLEALQAETAPLDPEQVKHNIEQIKKPFGDGGQMLDEARWKELRHNLVKGFTHLQLLDYIRHMEASKKHSPKPAVESADASSSSVFSSELSRIIDDKPGMQKAGRNRIKKRAAVSIMKDIWGFLPPFGEEEAEDVRSVTVAMSRRHIAALTAKSARPFRKISEAFKVKIDVFQEKSKLVIYGRIDAIEDARKALLSMRSEVNSVNIELGRNSNLLPSLRDGKYEQKLLEEIGRNRPLYIEKKHSYKAASSVRIFYHQSERQEADAARRDVLLAGQRIAPHASISVWPQLDQQPTWLVPYTSCQALPWWERLGSWGRRSFLQNEDTNARNTPTEHEAPTDALAVAVSQRLCNASTKFNAAVKSEPVTQQMTAIFGQAVFRRDIKQQLQSVLTAQQAKIPNIRRSNNQCLLHPASSSSPKMVTDVPLLAQSLASCKSWSIQSNDFTDSRSQPTLPGDFMHRLLLVCATADLPPLQVLLKGESSTLGLRQPLRIHSVSAILEERLHILLLPDRAVDIEFRRQTMYHIYAANQKKNPKHHGFLNQFLDYLNQAQGQEVPGFAAFVTLSLPSDLITLLKRIDVASARAPQGIESLPGVTDTIPPPPSATPTLPRKAGATEYILAASETIDVASFSHNAAKGLCLDHIQFCGLDGMQTRQELRLAERPYPDAETSRAPFSGLFGSAYAVASWLGDPKCSKEQL